MQPANNIMVLYTGGTIGMQASANGLAPASGFEARMREQLANVSVPAWRFKTGRGGQAIGAGLHADGATGVEHHEVIGWGHRRFS